MVTKRKLLDWTAKLLLVAVPAAISGYSSYAKAKIEAESQARASYETLQKAHKELREDFEALEKRLEAEAEAKKTTYPLAPQPVAAIPLRVRKAPEHKHVELPAKLEDAVQQYRSEALAK
jgi:DNA-directed RNA polymerase alpha subunit